jgi:hypothetical protein
MQISASRLTRLFMIAMLVSICPNGSAVMAEPPGSGISPTRAGCPNDDSGLKLPAGFCATLFADDTGHARHLVVSTGSVGGIAATITAGVMQPKQYRAPMPPMGGAQLSADQVSALAAYVWGLSHRAAAPK